MRSVALSASFLPQQGHVLLSIVRIQTGAHPLALFLPILEPAPNIFDH